jgi:hypothetical protein
VHHFFSPVIDVAVRCAAIAGGVRPVARFFLQAAARRVVTSGPTKGHRIFAYWLRGGRGVIWHAEA